VLETLDLDPQRRIGVGHLQGVDDARADTLRAGAPELLRRRQRVSSASGAPAAIQADPVS